MQCLKVTLVFCGLLTIAASSCNDGWIRHGPSCYHFSHDKEDWVGAMEMCKILGGTLLEINDADEDNFIHGQAVSRNSFEPWMALTDVIEENVWQWMVSETLLTSTSFTNWAGNEPNNDDGIENCAYMKSTGHWNDDQCYHTKYFVCEASDAGSVEVIG